MYTDQMKMAFHSIRPPKGFAGIELVDDEFFITIKLDEKNFFNLSDSDKRSAIEYVFKVKRALEDNGATVLIVRKAVGR